MSYHRSYIESKRLAKDSLHKKLSGVCAGIARHYDLPRIVVRAAALFALITFPVATGVAYIVANVLMPTR